MWTKNEQICAHLRWCPSSGKYQQPLVGRPIYFSFLKYPTIQDVLRIQGARALLWEISIAPWLGGRYPFLSANVGPYKMFFGYTVLAPHTYPLGNINSPRLGCRSFHTICVGAASGNNDVRHTFTSCNVIIIILHCHHHHDPHLPLIAICFSMTSGQ